MALEQYNPNGYIIRISETALIQMVLHGLEAYSVSHKGNGSHKTGLEVYGLIFGSEVALPNGKTFYSVDFLSVDTSAEMKRNAVIPNKKALELKRDVMTSFLPQYEFLGDFHTHPCREPHKEVLKRCYHNFSFSDYGHIMVSPKYWHQHGYRIGMLLTITLLKRKAKRSSRYIDNSTIEFSLGNYRLFLKGYSTMMDDDEKLIMFNDEQDVFLHCPSLTGLNAEYTQFGRGIKKPRLRHVCGKI